MEQGNITREDLARSLCQAHGGLSLNESHALVDAILDAVQEGLDADGRVKIRGFGTFEVVRREARTSRHPKTGELLQIPESNTVRFRPSRKFFSN
ncbi:MAG: HU family DNA-binding protein [Candidatus Coatesbacteria bacterium]|nr:HU family DNA-binding protein [Candidatus Coatesbacteria bacterium]